MGFTLVSWLVGKWRRREAWLSGRRLGSESTAFFRVCGTDGPSATGSMAEEKLLGVQERPLKILKGGPAILGATDVVQKLAFLNGCRPA